MSETNANSVCFGRTTDFQSIEESVIRFSTVLHIFVQINYQHFENIHGIEIRLANAPDNTT